jgi:hypothetical protein
MRKTAPFGASDWLSGWGRDKQNSIGKKEIGKGQTTGSHDTFTSLFSFLLHLVSDGEELAGGALEAQKPGEGTTQTTD